MIEVHTLSNIFIRKYFQWIITRSITKICITLKLLSSVPPSSGYYEDYPSLGLLIPALESPGIIPPTAEVSPGPVLSSPHIPAWLMLPAWSSSQSFGGSCKLQRGSPGSTADNVEAVNLSDDEEVDITGGYSSPLPQSFLQQKLVTPCTRS